MVSFQKTTKISEVLKKNNFKIKKKFGQNYILDMNLTNKIVKKSMPLCNTIIEIGPGPGGLTRAILENGGKKIYVIEKDEESIKLLTPLLNLYPKQLEIINDDALTFPIYNLGTFPRQVIANLPYNISTKFLIILLKKINNFSKITLMFQKEVANRLVADPGNKSYGRLSILTKLLTESKILFDVSNSAFYPKPKVTSSIVEITPLKKLKHNFNFENMEKITHFTFSKRRKMLRAIFKNHGGDKMLNEIGISPDKRPENLSLEEFCILEQKLFR